VFLAKTSEVAVNTTEMTDGSYRVQLESEFECSLGINTEKLIESLLKVVPGADVATDLITSQVNASAEVSASNGFTINL
jgi:hypothetical protein